MKKYGLYELKEMLGPETRSDVDFSKQPRLAIKVPSVNNPIAKSELFCKEDVKQYAAEFTERYGQSLFIKTGEATFEPVDNREFDKAAKVTHDAYKKGVSR